MAAPPEPIPPGPVAPTPAAPGPPAAPAWARVLSASVRLALIGLIAAAAWGLIDAYRGLVPPRGTAARPGPEAPPAADDPADWLLAPGAWSLGDAPWQLARATVTDAELAARLAATGPAPAGALGEVEAQAIAWLKNSGPGKPAGDLVEYTLTLNRTRFRGVVQPGPAGDRLRLGQVAWPDGAGGWQLLEVLPHTGPAATAEPLLPVPEGAAVVARRWAGGRVVADVVGPVPPDHDAPAGWARAGWAREATAGPGPTERFARGGAAREVWRFAGLPGAATDYLLIFVPPPVPGAAHE